LVGVALFAADALATGAFAGWDFTGADFAIGVDVFASATARFGAG
jgi:hypothetical protein